MKRMFLIFTLLISTIILSSCGGQLSNVKIDFDSRGGTDVPSIFVKSGSSISIPSVSREGFILEGWYTSLDNGITLDERWSFTKDKVNADITLFANWEIQSYTISFNSKGGTYIPPITKDYSTVINEPIEPTMDGHSFLGWYKDDEKYTFTTMPADDITLYAKWSINEYTISFNSNGGSSVDPVTKNYNSKIESLKSPTKKGYTFKGWYNDENMFSPFVLDSMPSYNMNLYAKWEINQYTISFLFEGEKIFDDLVVDFGSEVDLTSYKLEGKNIEEFIYNNDVKNSKFEYLYDHDIVLDLTLTEKMDITVRGNSLEWPLVEEVEYYVVYVNGTENKIYDNFFDFDSNYEYGIYDVQVIGVRDNINLKTNLIEIEKLKEPSNIRIEEGIITIDDVKKATGYILEINGKQYEFDNSNHFVLPEEIKDESIELRVKTLGDDDKTIDSNYTKIITFEVLTSPTLFYENSKLKWISENHEKVKTYFLYIDGEFVLDLEHKLSYDNFNDILNLKDNLRHELVIRAIGNDEVISSVLSNSLIKLETPNIKDSKGKIILEREIKWEEVPDSQGYKITLDGVENFLSEGVFEYKFNNCLGYDIKIQAIGTKDYISSETLTLTLIFTDNNQQYIYFGSYPQTVLDDEDIIVELNKQSQPNSRGYYQYEGEEYAKILADPLYETYEFSNGQVIIENTFYYFKVEPVKWLVFEEKNGEYTLLSDMMIDQHQFNNSSKSYYIDGKRVYGNNYELSTIREFLNGSFYDVAFNVNEKNIIITSFVDNGSHTTASSSNPYISDNTNDKVYLPSYQELYNNNKITLSNATDYSKAKHINKYLWWLRSPDNNMDSYSFVASGSSYFLINNVTMDEYGVRPVIKIVIE